MKKKAKTDKKKTVRTEKKTSVKKAKKKAVKKTKDTHDDHTLKILTHILGYFTSWIAPLIILVATKDDGVKEHAKRALNWHISLAIYSVISFILIFVLIGILFFIALLIMDVVFCIIAAVKASRDELWDYPLAIPFLR